MSEILIIYSTTDGHTKKICLRLKRVIEERRNHVTVIPVDNAGQSDLHAFDTIIIGASIRYGKHSPKIYQFIKENKRALDAKSSAFFSVNVVARKPEKSRPETNPYLIKFLRRTAWKPQKVAVFAGKIEYQKYGFLDRLMIRLIMLMTGGPTDPDTDIEFTNWKQVDDFGEMICDLYS